MIKGGYTGQYLEVDLTTRKTRAVTFPEDVLRKWVGGTGLGLYLLSQEITPNMRYTDPECPLYFFTGPLTGTEQTSSTNLAITSLNALLPYHPGMSHGHGQTGPRLKHAGWDGVILRGAADRPVWLWIDGENVEIRDAGHLWGKMVLDTTRAIQLELQDMAGVSVACIGPAGENLIPGAGIIMDKAFGCKKGGPGQIWGAKKLKAIAVRGSKKVPIADYGPFLDNCDTWKAAANALVGKYAWTVEAGGLKCMVGLGEAGIVHGKNFTDIEFAQEWARNCARDFPQWRILGVSTWNCDYRCHHETYVTTGPMAGMTGMGYGGEVIEEVGPNLGVLDPGISLAINSHVDNLGMDSAEVPRIIAAMMEAYETGRIGKDKTDGIELTWGNYEAITALIDKTINREGVGAIIAKGPREACRELGIEDLLVHIKGVGFNSHDQRCWGQALLFGSIMSGAGPTWQSLGYEITDEPDLGYENPVPRNDPTGKGRMTYLGQTKKMWEDCMGVCMFVGWGVRGVLDCMTRALQTAVGWQDWTVEEGMLLGERKINLMRLVSLYLGYKPEYDFDVSRRMMHEPCPGGPNKGGSLGPFFENMRKEYYDCLNWDPETGKPRPEALKKVGLEGFKVGKTEVVVA